MKIPCEITKDLLPLYHDEVCSNQSRIAVEEHLQECEACKKYLESLDSDITHVGTFELAEQAKSNVLKGIKKKLFRKNVMISVISVICATAVLLGGVLFTLNYQMPIPYEKGMVNVKMGDNRMLDVYFNGNDYYCSYKWTTTIEKDGVKQNIAYIYYTDTIWTKYFSKPPKDREYKYSINTSYWFNDGSSKDDIEVKREISAVYYLDYSDIPKLSKEDLIKNSSKAVLLWEK